jgi:hypothetical protein
MGSPLFEAFHYAFPMPLSCLYKVMPLQSQGYPDSQVDPDIKDIKSYGRATPEVDGAAK